ncbi:MAG: hypothetical protein US96_C0010G0002 [Candidatus Woesebacteria bacterium GW2011_GWB1_38_5b]|uniref:Uncharacterized protein n=1 Tax=Candidatus Woesebacteria bacterium GW2011_GWB1_38_5b TaxID=1618569 RepID=A0A0G0NEF1_9BACT|nr:MAG: hypothetical protein US96_C0010G0002 [Candidatus Woesebacteria bacterium GW2011_GWB1_38_5b]
MATERVTGGLARFVIDSARRLSGDAAQKLEEAQTLIGNQDITSAETVTGDAHDLLLGSNAKLNGVSKIKQEFPDRFLALLEEFGINENPPAEIFDEGPTPTMSEVDATVKKTKERKEADPTDLTEKQMKAVSTMFRIISEDTREEVSQRDVANIYYQNLIELGKPIGDILTLSRNNFKGVVGKLEQAFKLAGGEAAVLPFTREQLESLEGFPFLKQAATELSKMSGYDDMNLEALLEYTHPQTAVKVREKKADAPPNPGSDPVETVDVTQPLTNTERHLLFDTIFRRQSEMDDQNLREIREILNKEYQLLGYNVGVYDPEVVRQTLLTKLSYYQDLAVEKRKDYIKNNMGNLGGMVMTLIGPFMSSKDQLEEFLI